MDGALTIGASLALGGAWAWMLAMYLSSRGPLAAGRRTGRALTALMGASAMSTLVFLTGLAFLAAGGLA